MAVVMLLHRAPVLLCSGTHPSPCPLSAVHSGIGGTELNREVYDRLDDEISKVKSELKHHKGAFDRYTAC